MNVNIANVANNQVPIFEKMKFFFGLGGQACWEGSEDLISDSELAISSMDLLIFLNILSPFSSSLGVRPHLLLYLDCCWRIAHGINIL